MPRSSSVRATVRSYTDESTMGKNACGKKLLEKYVKLLWFIIYESVLHSDAFNFIISNSIHTTCTTKLQSSLLLIYDAHHFE